MERSRSNDVRSLGIELCTSRTDGRAITNCASNGALAMIGQIVRGGGGGGEGKGCSTERSAKFQRLFLLVGSRPF